MTTQQAKTIRKIEEQAEAQRWHAEQAAREQAQLDELSVIYAVEVKIAEGRLAEARQMWRAYRNAQKGK